MDSNSKVDFARELRRTQTLFEQQLWRCLRDRRFSQYKFRRQHPLGTYIVDFVCLERMLIVELDGSQHVQQQTYDEARDRWLIVQGFRVLRFWNNQWISEQEGVLRAIFDALQAI